MNTQRGILPVLVAKPFVQIEAQAAFKLVCCAGVRLAKGAHCSWGAWHMHTVLTKQCNGPVSEMQGSEPQPCFG